MQGVRMVHVATASGPFHARVIVARLGAAGILGQARGLDGPYPVLGGVDVLVPEDEAEEASALLAADARDAALGRQVDAAVGYEASADDRPPRTSLTAGLALATLVCMALVAVLSEVLAHL